MNAIFTLKTNYGKEYFYPVCTLAEALCALAKTKTLSRQTLDELISVGVKIEIVDNKTAQVLKETVYAKTNIETK